LPDASWEKQNPCQVSPRHTFQTENAKKRLFSSVLDREAGDRGRSKGLGAGLHVGQIQVGEHVGEHQQAAMSAGLAAASLKQGMMTESFIGQSGAWYSRVREFISVELLSMNRC
jgi:hypothetical protein